jgi:AraC family transcriptional regulator, transcriptional activator of pobA
MEKVFHTLQEFFKSIHLPLEQDTELTVHRLEGLHGDKPMNSPTFRTNYYAFLLISKGKGNYKIDNYTFDLGQHSFYFTNPGHLKSFQIEELMEGFMLTFSEKFVKQFFTGDFFQQFPFLIHESTPSMLLDEENILEIKQIFEQMLREYNGKSVYKNAILTNQLSVLLFRTKELLLTHRAVIKSDGRGGELANKFKAMIQENIMQLALGNVAKVLSVKEFAQKLNIHPNYLTNTVKEETGKSPSDWIQERLLAEAQALLRTNKTVSEIAYSLGFTDTTHFGKFFKKQTGLSAGEFRKK